MKQSGLYSFDWEKSRSYQIFDRDLLTEQWPKMPKSLQQILPAIHMFRNNQSRIANPSQLKVACLSGVSIKTVERGYKSLFEASWIDGYNLKTLGTNKKNIEITFPKVGSNKVYFKNFILESGIWFSLGKLAKALYMSILINSAATAGKYYSLITRDDEAFPDEVEELLDSIEDWSFTFCELNKSKLSKCSGFDRGNFNKAFEELRDFDLVATAQDLIDKYPFIFSYKISDCDLWGYENTIFVMNGNKVSPPYQSVKHLKRIVAEKYIPSLKKGNLKTAKK